MSGSEDYGSAKSSSVSESSLDSESSLESIPGCCADAGLLDNLIATIEVEDCGTLEIPLDVFDDPGKYRSWIGSVVNEEDDVVYDISVWCDTTDGPIEYAASVGPYYAKVPWPERYSKHWALTVAGSLDLFLCDPFLAVGNDIGEAGEGGDEACVGEDWEDRQCKVTITE